MNKPKSDVSPVAWISEMTLQNLQMPFLSQVTHMISAKANHMDEFRIPLYTAEQLHPVKELHPSTKAIYHEQLVIDGKVVSDKLIEKDIPKELTDEEILKEMEFLPQTISMEDKDYIAFARAILRKAQEK